MKIILQLITAAALTLFVGCSKHEESAEHAGHDHAGHKHAQAKPAASTAPSQRDPKRLWCEEHNVYEDECTICHPELKGKAKPATAQRLMCKEHGVPEDECGICHPELASKLKPGEGLKVRLPAADSAAIAGVQTAPPTAGVAADAIECYAEIAFNQTKFAQIVAPVAGIVQEVVADLGSKVGEKQVVARLWSAAIAESIAKAVLTHQVLDRERKLRAERVTSEKDLQEAEATHRAACQQLRTLGFTEEQVDELGRKPHEAVLLDVRAPFAGEIVERTAVRGALVEAGKPLFTLADRSTVWAMLNIPEAHLARVRVGQQVEFRVDSVPGQTFTGKLMWIGASVDERTRMARARAEVANPDGLLRDKMFAQARILVSSPRSSLLLPGSAIQYVDGRPFVFVRLEDDLYEARPVRLGAKLEGRSEVLAGLKPGDPVAVACTFALKSQLLLSRLGAGCADE
ncbi:MAG: efflux RND transporter periplasmic adaptor subunit [Verrucomicrobia bacterium]|nr:efflux RND transporter periplasmic adaptor subunit [Verrucomicrobiota bacterium]